MRLNNSLETGEQDGASLFASIVSGFHDEIGSGFWNCKYKIGFLKLEETSYFSMIVERIRNKLKHIERLL